MGAPDSDPTAYRSLAGALQYLIFTKIDIAYAVQQVCLHMHDPREPHLTAAKCILRYLQGTLDLGLLLRHASMSDLVVYTDADWAGCLDTRRSTSGYAVFLGNNVVSIQALRRSTVPWPTTWQRRVGFVSCLWSCTTPYDGSLWSTATTSALSTSPPTPFSTSAPSMLRLIFTLSASALQSGTFVFSTSR
jgi:hypothetical protein